MFNNPSKTKLSDKKVYVYLALIILFSTFLSISIYVFNHQLTIDEEGTIYNAFLISSGMKFYDSFYFFQKTPGIVAITSIIVDLFGNTFASIFFARLISVLAKAALIFVVFLIARRLFNDHSALFAALLVGLDNIIVAQGSLINPPIFATLFICMGVYFYLRQDRFGLVFCGVMFGISFLFRPTSLLISIPIALHVLFKSISLKKKIINLSKVILGTIIAILPLALYLTKNDLFYKFYMTVYQYNLFVPLVRYTMIDRLSIIFYFSMFKNPILWIFSLIGLFYCLKIPRYDLKFIYYWAGIYLLSFFAWHSFYAGYVSDITPALSILAGYGIYRVFFANNDLKKTSRTTNSNLYFFGNRKFIFLNKVLFAIAILYMIILNFSIPLFELGNLHAQRHIALSDKIGQGNTFVTSDAGILFLLGIKDPSKILYLGNEQLDAYKKSSMESVYGKRYIENLTSYLEKNKIDLILYSSSEMNVFLNKDFPNSESVDYIMKNYEPAIVDKNLGINFKLKKLLRKYLLFSETKEEKFDYTYFERNKD